MKIRTTKPKAGNKYYNNSANGGWSWCVTGQPVDRGCNVLSNCVGYACGRFNEIYGRMKFPKFCCNAENFIEVAKQYGLKVSKVPVQGGIMVWQKGSLNSYDGAGHVAIVEKVYSSNSILTSESGWNCNHFWTAKRTNNNGRWGMSSPYSFRGCIVNPAVKSSVKPSKEHYLDYITNYDMSFRTGADIKSKRIDVIPKGTRLRGDNVKGWLKTTYKGKKGYVKI